NYSMCANNFSGFKLCLLNVCLYSQKSRGIQAALCFGIGLINMFKICTLINCNMLVWCQMQHIFVMEKSSVSTLCKVLHPNRLLDWLYKSHIYTIPHWTDFPFSFACPCLL